MSNNRDGLTVRPPGTKAVLQALPAPTLRRYRRRWNFVAEGTRQDFLTVRPLGSNALLRGPQPTSRRYRSRWAFLAEVTRHDPDGPYGWLGWSWLVVNRDTGRYMALHTDHGTSALPQRKVAAALAELARARDEGSDPVNEGSGTNCAWQCRACAA